MAYFTSLTSKTFLWSFLSWDVQGPPVFLPWQRAPYLPQKHLLLLLFGVMTLSKFFLWLVVGSPATIAALFSFLLSKLLLNRNFLYLQVLLSVFFELLDTEEVPLTTQWLWKRDLTPASFLFQDDWHCEIILSFISWESDTFYFKVFARNVPIQLF